MKKTLIALTMAASAVVSGSAMAGASWEKNGGSGTVEIGGLLEPVTKVTPWEVATGAAYTELRADIQINDTKAEVHVPKALPVLAIRSTMPFTGTSDIKPTIKYGWISSDWKDSVVTATAAVMDPDAQNKRIGTATFPLSAIAVTASSRLDGSDAGIKLNIAEEGQAYFGGVPASSDRTSDIRSVVKEGWPDIDQKYIVPEGARWFSPGPESFSDPEWKYSSYYGSVIAKGSKIKINLNAPVNAGDPFAWRIRLPATVIYQ